MKKLYIPSIIKNVPNHIALMEFMKMECKKIRCILRGIKIKISFGILLGEKCQKCDDIRGKEKGENLALFCVEGMEDAIPELLHAALKLFFAFR